MSSFARANTLLIEIAEAGLAHLARPVVTDIEAHREVVARLRAQLDDFGNEAGRRYLNVFAPLMLQALDRALYFRRVFDGATASRFDGMVGFLVEHVRADGRAALDAMRDS